MLRNFLFLLRQQMSHLDPKLNQAPWPIPLAVIYSQFPGIGFASRAPIILSILSEDTHSPLIYIPVKRSPQHT